MGFLPPEPPEHRCSTPPLGGWFRRQLPAGTRWQCDECQEIWVVHLHLAIGQGRYWRQENPKPPKPPSGGGGIPTRRTW
jgi:hypothetical protein